MGRLDEKRGRERDAEATRQAILAAAEHVFAQHGFSGARVETIAEEAGYNKALLFRYFNDKRGLYQAVVHRCIGEVNSQLGEFLAPFAADANAALDAARVREFLARATGWMFDFYLAHPNHRRILIWEAAEGFNTSQGWSLPVGAHSWRDATVALLERARAGGIVRAELDPIALITNVMGMSLIYLASLPRYAKFFAERDLASAEGLAHARAQMVALVIHGTMSCPEGEHCAAGL